MNNVIWRPQPKQFEFMARNEDEALYGGAAGGGKSDALVIEATRQVHIPHYKALILRKTYPQLTELINKSLRYYPPAFKGAKYNASEHTWKFPSGATITFGSMQHTKDRQNYQGKSYAFIAFDELTHFSFDEYIYLLSRNRADGEGVRCYVRATANPGGIGHGWVKERFITAAEPLTTIWEKTEVEHKGKITTSYRSRVFVPSSVFDNQKLLENDPQYVARLAALPEAERKALLYGDWNSYAGQFFSEWRDNPDHYKDRLWTHVIDPFEIPAHWKMYRSFDYGYARPFSCGYWTIDEDGVIYRITEWYGCTGTPNVGLRLSPDELFRQMASFEQEHPWLKGRHIHGVADPSIWDGSRGESVEDCARKHGIFFVKGDNARIAGWQQCRNRLHIDKDTGKPNMYVFKNCKDFIRTIPLQVHDATKPEELDTDLEDHAIDEFRYFAMHKKMKTQPLKQEDTFYKSPLHTVFDIKKEDLAPRRSVPRTEILQQEEE